MEKGDSVRGIDDYTEPGANGCVTTTEKVDVSGIDHVAALARLLLSAVDPATRAVCIHLSDGSVLEGVLHSSLSLGDASAIVGKLWDLSKAYRQLARFPGMPL